MPWALLQHCRMGGWPIPPMGAHGLYWPLLSYPCRLAGTSYMVGLAYYVLLGPSMVRVAFPHTCSHALDFVLTGACC